MKIRIFKKTIIDYINYCKKENKEITNLIISDNNISPDFEIIKE